MGEREHEEQGTRSMQHRAATGGDHRIQRWNGGSASLLTTGGEQCRKNSLSVSLSRHFPHLIVVQHLTQGWSCRVAQCSLRGCISQLSDPSREPQRSSFGMPGRRSSPPVHGIPAPPPRRHPHNAWGSRCHARKTPSVRRHSISQHGRRLDRTDIFKLHTHVFPDSRPSGDLVT